MEAAKWFRRSDALIYLQNTDFRLDTSLNHRLAQPRAYISPAMDDCLTTTTAPLPRDCTP